MEERASLLRRLVEFKEPTRPLLDALRKLGWDWEGEPLLVLRRNHFEAIFECFFSGELKAQDLEEWAECLECREDVAFDEKDEKVLDDLLFCLANPAINYELTPENVKLLQRELETHGS